MSLDATADSFDRRMCPISDAVDGDNQGDAASKSVTRLVEKLKELSW
ncbi:hypothetical protein [Parafrankia sp. EUN1f]|nr:hypothetical protein [Parafrankia sp. EUN1f]EFC78704.1 hypothetical protein FrEUN1fDRAFT_8175 [Parafrankia sp. EUN1f]EFC79209.1 hypothetical protein FrEUN1fDRAFT_7680 [Parafrankia sp. EUN1f]EFC80367.1 hypothetical protein FrEUN1fDRAFT_6498 [Parafrankia sp. EUN1f]